MRRPKGTTRVEKVGKDDAALFPTNDIYMQLFSVRAGSANTGSRMALI